MVIIMMNFTMIGNDIMCTNISNGAFRLYVILKSYCYGKKTTCFPSQITLGERMRKSVKTIQRYLNELIAAKLVKKQRRGSISNQYEILRKSMENTVSELKEKSGDSPAQKERPNISYPQKKSKNSFGDYPQRSYNFENLEAILSGKRSDLTYADCVLNE